MNDGKALEWGICGVGVLPGDARMRDALHAQDCLYTLVEKSPDGSQQARVIGSIVEYLLAPDDPEAVVEKMADAAIKIVSLTVTEGGYNFHAVTGEFQADNPGVHARPGAGRGAADDVRPGRRGARAATAARHPAVHGAVLRQHPGQRGRRPPQLHRVRPAARPEAGRVGGAGGAVPQLHGRPHHPGHHRRRPGRAGRAVRRRGQVAGGVRAVHAVGARGRLRPRPSAGRGRRGAGRRRRRAVRADEAAAAQRQPPGAVLPRLPRGLPAGARRLPGPAVRRVPARLHGPGGHAVACARCRGSTCTPTSGS